MQEKILVGHKLRRFRQSSGLSQTAMAEALDISPSYLNLLEHNQRPLTVPLLLRLGNSFDIDMKSFAEDDSPALMTELSEVFADPILSSERVSRRELQDLITAAPSAARSMLNLFQAYRKVRDQLEFSSGDGRQAGGVNSPVEQVRETLQQANNYFAEVEEAAQALREAVAGSDGGDTADRLLESVIRHAATDPRVRVRIISADVMNGQLRRYDYHRRELLISEALRRSQRTFHLLVQLALITQSDMFDQLCETHEVDDGAARSLFRSTLAGYFAGAVMMPYDGFLAAARELRHDLDLLGRRFGASFEQVCHRLTSLNAPMRAAFRFSSCALTMPAIFPNGWRPAACSLPKTAAPVPAGTYTKHSARLKSCCCRLPSCPMVSDSLPLPERCRRTGRRPARTRPNSRLRLAVKSIMRVILSMRTISSLQSAVSMMRSESVALYASAWIAPSARIHLSGMMCGLTATAGGLVCTTSKPDQAREILLRGSERPVGGVQYNRVGI